MQSSFILTLDHGDDTDFFAIADEVKNLLDGQGGFIVIECKPFPKPALYPPPPLGAPGGPQAPLTG